MALLPLLLQLELRLEVCAEPSAATMQTALAWSSADELGPDVLDIA